MRIRTIKPDFWTSESVGCICPHSRLLFIGLWQMADREGRLEERPGKIKATLFPYDNELEIEPLLDELEEAGLIQSYDVGDRVYLAIPGFLEHQRPNHREPQSILPEPPKNPGTPRKTRARLGTPGRKGREGKGKEGKEEGTEPGTPGHARAASAEDRLGNPLLEFPCKGRPASWTLYEKNVEEWEGLFPGVDVMAVCRKALAWARTNKMKRRTAGRMEHWLTQVWIARESDRTSHRFKSEKSNGKTVEDIEQELREFRSSMLPTRGGEK